MFSPKNVNCFTTGLLLNLLVPKNNRSVRSVNMRYDIFSIGNSLLANNGPYTHLFKCTCSADISYPSYSAIIEHRIEKHPNEKITFEWAPLNVPCSMVKNLKITQATSNYASISVEAPCGQLPMHAHNTCLICPPILIFFKGPGSNEYLHFGG